jgi:hypothetical protein
MRMPEAGPLGETFFEASVRAMVAASWVKRPAGGCVESVLTPATQSFSSLTRAHLPPVLGMNLRCVSLQRYALNVSYDLATGQMRTSLYIRGVNLMGMVIVVPELCSRTFLMNLRDQS